MKPSRALTASVLIVFLLSPSGINAQTVPVEKTVDSPKVPRTNMRDQIKAEQQDRKAGIVTPQFNQDPDAQKIPVKSKTDDGAIDPDNDKPEEQVEELNNDRTQIAVAKAATSGGSSQLPVLNSLNVQVEPFSGGASMAIPISVASGRAGIQPSVAVVYSSSAPESYIGVGWTMDLGYIQRSNKFGVPKFDSTDTFVLTSNGSTQELVFDAAKNVYRPEIEEGFSKIENKGTYWCLTDKKGTKYFFGNTSDSKHWNPEDNSKVFRWAINRVEDLNGNYMTYQYRREDGNFIYPQKIEYTGNSKTGQLPYAKVEFDYTQVSRMLEMKRSGFSTRSFHLLDAIRVSVNGSLQSKYEFKYTNSAITKRYLLTSVKQIGADGVSSLPPVTFTYEASGGFQFTPWTYPQEDDMYFARLTSKGYWDNGVRFVDINADAYPDLMRDFRDCDFQASSANYLHNKSNGFTKTEQWKYLSSRYLTHVRQCGSHVGGFDYGVRTVDVNADGWQDVIWSTYLRDGNNYNLVYLSDKNGNFVESRPWVPPDDTFITKESADGYMLFSGVQYADVNGDQYVDIVWSKRGENAKNWVYLNNIPKGGTGWSRDPNWDVPVSEYTDLADGATLADINGDGLVDIVYAVDRKIVVHYNIGNGFRSGVPEVTPWDNPPMDVNLRTGLSQFADVNGDGLVDIVNADDQVRVLINTGAGWHLDDSLWKFWSGSFRRFETRLADVNADGMLDYFYSLSGDNLDHNVLINRGKPSDYLIKIDNGLGAISEIVYGSSAQQANTFLPFPMQVVKSLTVKEASGSNYTTRYEYSQGLWEAADREFRGYGLVKVIDPDGNYSISTYHQDKYFKGRAKEQAVYSAAGVLFAKTTNTWQRQAIIPGSDFVFLKRTDQFVYDGGTTPRRTAQEYFYDEPVQYGNVTKAISYGEVNASTGADASNDRRTVLTTYYNNPSLWLLGLPKQVTVQNNLGTQVRQTSMYYDGSSNFADVPSRGLLTRKIDWAGSSATTHPVTQYSYDTIGNLKTTTDPMGNVTSIVYDAALNMFPVTTTNALGHQVKTEYYGVNGVALKDAAGYAGLWGQVKSVADANNQKAYRVYDTFGRLLKSISPLDTLALPGTSMEYTLTNRYTQVLTRQRVIAGSANTLNSSSFYDGLGRLIQAKTPSGTSGQFIVSGQSRYNARGLEERKYLPRFTTNGLTVIDDILPDQPSTLITYDAMGRVSRVTNTDGTYSNTVYSVANLVKYDERGAGNEYLHDVYGRVVRIREFGGYDGRTNQYPKLAYWVSATSFYSYDSEGNLTRVMDAKDNITNITYDNLGRKISMQDPDMGTWTYTYDLNGNLKTQKDAKGQVLTFSYDKLNRLVNKSDGVKVNVTYTYDDPAVAFSKGRLTRVQYGQDYTQFFYDFLGREIKSVKVIAGVPYTVERTYDNLNNILKIKYPDQSEVFYQYNAAGQINAVGNDAGIMPVSVF